MACCCVVQIQFILHIATLFALSYTLNVKSSQGNRDTEEGAVLHQLFQGRTLSSQETFAV
ncbi:MAG: hypothetical protein ACOZBL_03420 [Patescibacteria group bacterium]